MRRGISILLALIFGMGPLSSVLPGAEDMNLPPCCRRHGAHHCAMAAHMAAMIAAAERDDRTSASTPNTCPFYPGPTLALLMPAAHAMAAAAAEAPLSENRIPAPQPAQRAYTPGPSRAYAGRGPPLFS